MTEIFTFFDIGKSTIFFKLFYIMPDTKLSLFDVLKAKNSMTSNKYILTTFVILTALSACSRNDNEHEKLGNSGSAKTQSAFSQGSQINQKTDQLPAPKPVKVPVVDAAARPGCNGGMELAQCELVEAKMKIKIDAENPPRMNSENIKKINNIVIDRQVAVVSKSSSIIFVKGPDATKPLDQNADRMIGKKQALDILDKELRSQPGYPNSSPVQKQAMSCLFKVMINEIFKSDIELIKASSLEKRIADLKFDSSNPETTKKLTKCVELVSKEMPKKESVPPVREAALMDIDDFRLDYKTLVGKNIKVQGVGYYVMNLFMLKKTPTDMNPILVDISIVSRAQKKRIMQECIDVMNGCKVVVHGVVGQVSYQNGIIAASVE